MKSLVLKKIERKPGAYFKRWLTVCQRQNFHTRTFDMMSKSFTAEDYLLSEWKFALMEKYQDNYEVINHLANIIEACDLPDDLYFNFQEDYDEDWLYVGEQIAKTYTPRMKAYKDKKLEPMPFPFHSTEEAYKELVFRGFVPIIWTDLTPKHYYYLKATIPPLVYPKKVTRLEQVIELQFRLGIEGYVGYNQPEEPITLNNKTKR